MEKPMKLKDLKFYKSFDESSLTNTKWFEYRVINEIQSLYLFIDCFDEAFMNFSYRNGVKYYWIAKDLEKGFEHNWKYFNIFMILRQFCDANTIKYCDFWNLMFLLIKEKNIKFKVIQPHLFTSKFLKKAFIEKYFRYYEKIIAIADIKIKKYSNTEVQNAYIEHLLVSIKKLYPNNYLDIIQEQLNEGEIPKDYFLS
jgi:hypothetical protein